MDQQDSIKLESISLNNIRRFGKDVEIKFGAGATIVVAPNGSGKTAVFEAIELALTSGVRRVDGRFHPLIRDGGERASVRLNFGKWEREVSVTGDGVEVVNEGQLKELFHNIKPEEIPFLLRLTHLLDQRDSTWFCQQNSTEEAGGQLAMLPLGRQASQVSATVARLKPAISRKMTELSGTIDTKKNDLDAWNALIKARDDARTDLSKPLVPLAELVDALARIDGNTSYQSLDSTASVREQWAIVHTKSTQRLVEIQEVLNNLAGVILVPAAYVEMSGALKKSALELDSLKRARDGHQIEVKALNDRFALIEPTHRQLNADVATQRTKLQQKQLHLKTIELLASREADLAAKSLSLEKQTSAFEEVQQAYQAALSRSDINTALVAQSEKIEQRRKDLADATHALDRWSKFESEKVVTDQKIKESLAAVDSCEKQLALATTDTQRCELAYRGAKAHVDAYQQAAGAIRSAVAAIAEQLPEDADACPVCMVSHGRSELRRRIGTALAAIDPQLNQAMQALRSATTDWDEAKKKEGEKKSEVNAMQIARAQLTTRLAEIVSDIAETRRNAMLAGLELAELPAHLEMMRKEVDGDSASLDARRQNEPAPLDVNSMTELTAHHAKMKRDLEELAETQTRVSESIAEARSSLAIISPAVAPEVSVDEIENKILELSAKIDDAVDEIKKGTDRKSELAGMLLNCDSSISRVSQQLELDEGRFKTQISQWEAAGMIGAPSAEELERVKASHVEQQQIALDAKKSLGEIETELARTTAAHAFNTAQQAVDVARSQHTEQECSRNLADLLAEARAAYASVSVKKGALDAFSEYLTTGISKIRDEVENIVPQWQAILKRIVQEPRFSGTHLSYFKRNNKNHATVEVGLGAGHAAVADIASQAQMTDLQLSFLLSMATVHQWSPWKALLLDDPTQHHDLVHASSVFDVLRDFIAEHGFQVILTTHDAQQARFLMRKLSNDGIDARLWTLLPTQNGMMAEQIG